MTMNAPIDMESLNLNIQRARRAAEELKRLGEDFPAVARNAERILASLKMLEINVCDIAGSGFASEQGRWRRPSARKE
jgi:hypothetical protein